MHVEVFKSKVPVVQQGHGKIPLVIVGPASLFIKEGMLLDKMRDWYTIYFVDIFSESICISDIDNIFLDDFVAVLESLRTQLGLDNVSLFAHSAMGVLAYEYAIRNPDKTHSLILVAASPIWTECKEKSTESFFKLNSSQKRKERFLQDKTQLSVNNARNDRDEFIKKYVSRRSHFFYDFNHRLASERMWDNVDHNIPLVLRYFNLIHGYDARMKPMLSVPTFLALGICDASLPFFLWTDDSSQVLKSIYYYIFDKSGHYPMMEEPEKFIDELKKFIKNNQLSGLKLRPE